MLVRDNSSACTYLLRENPPNSKYAYSIIDLDSGEILYELSQAYGLSLAAAVQRLGYTLIGRAPDGA